MPNFNQSGGGQLLHRSKCNGRSAAGCSIYNGSVDRKISNQVPTWDPCTDAGGIIRPLGGGAEDCVW